MRAQRIGARYLAGLVMVASLAYFAVTTVEAAQRSLFWLDYLILGLASAAIAFLFGIRGWKMLDGRSWVLSAVGLMILLIAFGLSQWAQVDF